MLQTEARLFVSLFINIFLKTKMADSALCKVNTLLVNVESKNS